MLPEPGSSMSIQCICTISWFCQDLMLCQTQSNTIMPHPISFIMAKFHNAAEALVCIYDSMCHPTEAVLWCQDISYICRAWTKVIITELHKTQFNSDRGGSLADPLTFHISFALSLPILYKLRFIALPGQRHMFSNRVGIPYGQCSVSYGIVYPLSLFLLYLAIAPEWWPCLVPRSASLF